MSPKVSLVCPVYKEDKNIVAALNQITKKVHVAYEVLIVYDFAADPTVPVVKKYLQHTRNRRIRLIKNDMGTGRGVLNAIKTGFARSRGQAVVVVMADLSDDISQIDTMSQLIDQGYDIVCASRYMSGGKKIGGPWLKTWLSRLAGLSLKFVFGVPTTDATNAYKMYRRQVLDTITLESTGGFEYSLEIILKAFKHGFSITEIPTVWRDRVAGQSNFKIWKWLPSYLKQYLLILK